MIARINQLTVQKAFQNELHNISHTGDEEVAIVKRGLHSLIKHSQKWILLYILTYISSVLLVKTTYASLSAFNIKSHSGLKNPIHVTIF